MTVDYEAWAAVIMFVALISLPGWSALYIARKRNDPTAYAAMEATIRGLSEQVAAMHAEISRLQTKVADLTLGVSILSSQLMGLGHKPEYPVATVEDASDTPTVDPKELYARLSKEFDGNELDDLAFRLGVNADDLGEATVSGKARALIAYAKRHGEFDKLVAAMYQVRPPRGKF